MLASIAFSVIKATETHKSSVGALQDCRYKPSEKSASLIRFSVFSLELAELCGSSCSYPVSSRRGCTPRHQDLTASLSCSLTRTEKCKYSSQSLKNFSDTLPLELRLPDHTILFLFSCGRVCFNFEGSWDVSGYGSYYCRLRLEKSCLLLLRGK